MWFLKDVPSTVSTRSEFIYDRKPDTATRCEHFRDYLWNREERTACNRTALSWGLLIGFYMAFIFFFVGLCIAMVFVGVTLIDSIQHGALIDVGKLKHELKTA